VGERRGQEIWSARITLSYRALAIKREDGYLWFWIGDHKTYDKQPGTDGTFTNFHSSKNWGTFRLSLVSSHFVGDASKIKSLGHAPISISFDLAAPSVRDIQPAS
jgi:hypothetical protein